MSQALSWVPVGLEMKGSVPTYRGVNEGQAHQGKIAASSLE